MKNSETNTSTIEELLEAAGFSFEIVDRCPDPSCGSCTRDDLAVAA